MSSSNSLPTTFSQLPPPLPYPPPDQLYYVHCNVCDTILAVSVPSASLFKMVTVRCGHCANLLPVNMRGGGLLPSTNQFRGFTHSAAFFSPNAHNLLDEISNPNPNFLMNQTDGNDLTIATRVANDIPRQPPTINRQQLLMRKKPLIESQ